MQESQACTELLTGALTWLDNFLKGYGPLLFASLAAAKVMVYRCGPSRYPEVRELASVLITAFLLGLLIAATESKLPVLMTQALSCKGPGSQESAILGKAPRASSERRTAGL